MAYATLLENGSVDLHIVLWLGEDLEEQALAAGCARERLAVHTLHGGATLEPPRTGSESVHR